MMPFLAREAAANLPRVSQNACHASSLMVWLPDAPTVGAPA